MSKSYQKDHTLNTRLGSPTISLNGSTEDKHYWSGQVLVITYNNQCDSDYLQLNKLFIHII